MLDWEMRYVLGENDLNNSWYRIKFWDSDELAIHLVNAMKLNPGLNATLINQGIIQDGNGFQYRPLNKEEEIKFNNLILTIDSL